MSCFTSKDPGSCDKGSMQSSSSSNTDPSSPQFVEQIPPIAGTPQPHLQPQQTSGNMNTATSSGDMTALWLKLQQQHAQETVAGRQQQIPTPQQPLPLQPGLQNLGMLRAGQPGVLPNAGSIPQQQQQGMAPGGFRMSQPSQAENDFWQQLQKR